MAKAVGSEYSKAAGTKSTEFRKELENLGEPRVSVLLSGSEHGTTTAPPQICNAYTGMAGSADRVTK